MSIEHINRFVSSKSEEDDCSNNETECDTQHGKWIKVIGKPGLKIKIQNSKNPLECFELLPWK